MWLSSPLQASPRGTMYGYGGDLSGELVLSPGNAITPKHKADDDWHASNSSSASVSALQAVSQTPQLQPLQQFQVPALCRALCDFNPEEMNLEDSKYFLSFLEVCHSKYRVRTHHGEVVFSGSLCVHNFKPFKIQSGVRVSYSRFIYKNYVQSQI